jgi:hypothetical protein
VKLFHLSDVLSVTTGRLVSTRHIDGVYDLLNFLTGDRLFTHQLPRASRECEPWLRSQFPQLMEDSAEIAQQLNRLSTVCDGKPTETERAAAVASFVENIRRDLGLPEMIPVYEMGVDMHTRIDPIDEARAMFGDSRVLTIDVEDSDASA